MSVQYFAKVKSPEDHAEFQRLVIEDLLPNEVVHERIQLPKLLCPGAVEVVSAMVVKVIAARAIPVVRSADVVMIERRCLMARTFFRM